MKKSNSTFSFRRYTCSYTLQEEEESCSKRRDSPSHFVNVYFVQSQAREKDLHSHWKFYCIVNFFCFGSLYKRQGSNLSSKFTHTMKLCLPIIWFGNNAHNIFNLKVVWLYYYYYFFSLFTIYYFKPKHKIINYIKWKLASEKGYVKYHCKYFVVHYLFEIK